MTVVRAATDGALDKVEVGLGNALPVPREDADHR
jgi:hypothetical protein